MDRRLNGLNPLAYIGTNPYTPSDFVIHPRAPTVNDWQNFELLTVWMDSTTQNVWILVALAGNRATWVLFTSSSGSVVGLRADDNNIAHPLNGIINIHNTDTNVVTTAATANTVTINLANNITISGTYTTTGGNIVLPNTNATFTQGVIQFGTTRFISDFGTQNTFVGASSGNGTVTGSQNVGIGDSTLQRLSTGSFNTVVGSTAGILITTGTNNTSVGTATLSMLTTGSGNTAVGQATLGLATTGSDNTAIGQAALSDLTTGSNNTALGFDAGEFLLTGSNNVLIGNQAGLSYVAAESSNIIIGNVGVVSENNVIRIGTDGTGAGQQSACTIAGAVTAVRSLTTPTVYASGDAGGVAAQTAVTNVTNLTANGAGTFTIASKSANNATSAGFIKIYIGATAYWIPVFTNPAP